MGSTYPRTNLSKIVLCASLFLFLTACGEKPSKKSACEAEESRSCSCPDGTSGQAVCQDNQWSLCDCVGTPACTSDDECGSDTEPALCVDAVCQPDSDGDSVVDTADNCPDTANPDQADSDQDGVGDACATTSDDIDGDGVPNDSDNCPDVSNADQEDLDGDRTGDACDTDADGDFVDDPEDNCPRTSNGDQSDNNNDGVGDACDQDSDGIRNVDDNCANVANADQSDIDMDGDGDRCDGDLDGDGVSNPIDLCPNVPDPDQLDTDSDREGDACDEDDDNDSHLDADDNCPLVRNITQTDTRMNGIGDACDDPDMDGFPDSVDNCPDEANPAQTVVDMDMDGLMDCIEAGLGLDPTNPDADDDGLLDGEEINIYGSDPLDGDTDDDGLDDGEEVMFGLDPTNPYTHNDGILDSMRPGIILCQSVNPQGTSVQANAAGDYSLALPASFSARTNLTITTATAQNGYAASVFDDAASEISGFILTYNSGQTAEAIAGAGGAAISSGDFLHDYVTSNGWQVVRTKEFETTGNPAVTRNGLLFNKAPFNAAEVSNLPTPAASSTTQTRGHLSVISRGGLVTIIGVYAPVSVNAAVTRLMEDVSNFSGFAPFTASKSSRCAPTPPATAKPQAEIYWVLDQSGSMSDDYSRLQTALPAFATSLASTNLDYRFGITNMDQQIDGRIRSVPGWHTSLTAFTSEIQDYVINCTGCGSTSGYAEWGLTGSQSGLTWMKNAAPSALRSRTNADVYTIFMSDEEPQSIQDAGGFGSSASNTLLNGFTTFFAQETVAFAAAGGGGCSDGRGYRSVARASGGQCADLSQDLGVFLARVREEVVGFSSPYTFPVTPVSASISVYLDGTPVPRDKINGWYYHAASNSIAFMGTAVPPTNGTTGIITVVYDTWAP